MSAKPGPSRAQLTALFVLSAGTLAFEVLLLRLFEYSHWHHFAGLAIALALLGLGAAGTVLALLGRSAIVVADGIAIRLQKGMDRRKAAIEAATQPSLPLLGATIVAVMAFYPIFASIEGAGPWRAGGGAWGRGCGLGEGEGGDRRAGGSVPLGRRAASGLRLPAI